MNRNETEAVAGYVYAALDRPVPAPTVAVWADILEPLPYRVAILAVREIMRTSPHVPHPADIMRTARQIERQEAAERARSGQLTARAERAESAPTVAATTNWGYGMVSNVLGALKSAGQDIMHGRRLGVDRASAIAERAMLDYRRQHPAPQA